MGEIRVYRKKKTGILLTVLLLVTVTIPYGEFERKMDTGSLAINGEGEKFPKELAYMLRDTFLENGWRGVRELLDAGEQSRGREEADISGRKPGTGTGLAWDRVSALTEEDIFRHFPLIEEYRDRITYEYEPYDAETGKYSLWNTLYPPYDHLLGTRKVLEYDGVHMKIDYGYYELDRNGEAEYSAYLYYLPLNLFEQICLAMLPAHTDPSLNEEVMEEVKQCGIYARETGKWYFRVTEEQFWALADAFEEALESAREQEKKVLFTYEELFGQS